VDFFINTFSFSTSLIVAQSDLDKVGTPQWGLMAFICIAFGAMGYYCLQFGVVKSKAVATFGIVALVAAGLLVAVTQTPRLELYVFYAFAALATAGGIAFLTARQPVYAALGFATAILSGAGVLFMESALFVAAATMIVYAGATIIIFLFVLMFAHQGDLTNYDVRLNHPALASVIGAILLGTVVMAVQAIPESDAVAGDAAKVRPLSQSVETVPSSTAGLGRSMFTEYLFTVELAGTLLLVATIGSIAVAQRSLEAE